MTIYEFSAVGSAIGTESNTEQVLHSTSYEGFGYGSESYVPVKKIYKNILDGVHIVLNGVEITKYLVEYSRDWQICTGIQQGMLKIIDFGQEIYPWDIVDIYEYDEKVVKFIVNKVDKPANEKAIILEMQDMSYKLVNYLIDQTFDLSKPIYSEPESNPARLSGYWIKKFLEMAGVEYADGDYGSYPMNPNTILGFQMAHEQILTLLQMNGLFLWFDPDGVARIGKLQVGKSYSGYTYNLTDKNILSIIQRKDDAQLRNWAVVWGNSNPMYPLVFVSMKKHTSWQIDQKDWRVVCLSNASIYSLPDAKTIAKNILDTFSQALKEKEVEFVYDPGPIKIGDLVHLDSQIFQGTGRVTTVQTKCNQGTGLKNTIIMDQRCPRLFAYIGYPPEYFYGPVGSLVRDEHMTMNYPLLRSDDLYEIRSANITGSIMNVEML